MSNQQFEDGSTAPRERAEGTELADEAKNDDQRHEASASPAAADGSAGHADNGGSDVLAGLRSTTDVPETVITDGLKAAPAAISRGAEGAAMFPGYDRNNGGKANWDWIDGQLSHFAKLFPQRAPARTPAESSGKRRQQPKKAE